MAVNPKELPKLVAANIRSERVKAGLSQTALAKKIGVTDRYVQRLEQSPKNLSLESLARISNALGVPIARLFGDVYGEIEASKAELDAVRVTVRILESYLGAKAAGKSP